MIDKIRLLNILSQLGSGGQSPTTPDQAVQQPMPPRMAAPQPGPDDSDLADLFNPQHSAEDRYNQNLNSMPQRDQYQPTRARSILAALAGLGTARAGAYQGGAALGFEANVPGSLAVQDYIKDEPYNKALNDWTAKEQPLGKLATLENTRNVNSRLIGSQILSDRRAGRRQTEIEAQNDEKNRQADFRNDTARQRANLAEFKAKNPNHIMGEDKDGYVIGYDPQSDKITYATDDDGNPIQSSKMSDADKYNNQFKNAKELETFRQQNRMALEEAQVKGRKEVKETPPAINPNAGTSNKPESSTQKAAGQFSRAMEAANRREWSKYVVPMQGKTFTLTIPPGGDSGTYNEVYKFIYGKYPDTELPPEKATSAPAGKVEGSRVRISDGNGHFGSVTVEDSKKLPAPWKVVQ